MPRIPKAWFYRQTGWWTRWLNGRKVKLFKGKASKIRSASGSRSSSLATRAGFS